MTESPSDRSMVCPGVSTPASSAGPWPGPSQPSRSAYGRERCSSNIATCAAPWRASVRPRSKATWDKPVGFPAELELAKQAASDLYVEKLAVAHAGSAIGAAWVNASPRGAARPARRSQRPQAITASSGRRRTPEGHAAKRPARNLFVGRSPTCFVDPEGSVPARHRALRRQRSDHRPLPTASLPELPCRRETLPAWEARLAQVRADLASVTCPLRNVNILPNSETVSKRPSTGSNDSPTDNNDEGRPRPSTTTATGCCGRWTTS